MATDALDLPRLSELNLDSLRARMIATVNLGLVPGDPLFLDAEMGGLWGDIEGVVALELDEFYDLADEVARAVLPATAYGQWLDGWALSLGLERKDEARAGGVVTFTGTPGATIPAGFPVTTIAPANGEAIAFQTIASGEIPGGGSVDLDVTAVDAGSSGNVGAGTVTEPAYGLPGVTGVNNAERMTGGADVETDQALSGRVRDSFAGTFGSGTVDDYRRWGLAWPGVGYVTVDPLWDGAGTVRVFITDTNNDPMPTSAIDGLQAQLDPVPGEGRGLAPIGHTVTVATPSAADVTSSATILFRDGYSLDGTGGTIASGPTIKAALARYVNGLDTGADVIYNAALAAMMTASPGVLDVQDLLLNAAATDVAIAGDEVAAMDEADITLT